MITQTAFYNGALYTILTGNATLTHYDNRRVTAYQPDLGGYTVRLPNATFLRLGGPSFYVLNVDAQASFDLVDYDQVLVRKIDPLRAAIVCLIENSTPAGRWSHGIFEFVL